MVFIIRGVMNLGQSIYKLRTEKNMSQGDLADVLEVSRQSVSKWENNSAVPELEKLMKMAQLFEVSLDELVSGEVHEPKAEPAQMHTPAQEPARRFTTAQMTGIILLAFGGLCFLVFTVVGIFTAGILMGLAIALPFLLCGLICLLCKCNIGLKCAWSVYLCLWVFLTVFMVR